MLNWNYITFCFYKETPQCKADNAEENTERAVNISKILLLYDKA